MEDMTLVVNAGSSSLKLALFDQNLKKCASGLAERLGEEDVSATITDNQRRIKLAPGSGHRQALAALISAFRDDGQLGDLPVAIGHRVVHGGETFHGATLINQDVLAAIGECTAMAPLHNPVNLAGIEATRALFPGVPQVAVFDTAFHQTLPQKAYLYGVPLHFYRDWGVRRYGFHGISHQFMVAECARILGKTPATTSIISAHLGNGCSITAVRNGNSVDTSMGLTPLEGLVMGTRSGDVDPGLADFLTRKGVEPQQLHRILNTESGLLGLSGQSNDMRALCELADHGHEPSRIAIDVFCFRLARYIGAMMASLGDLDALVFTGGIGENSGRVRAQTLDHLGLLGFTFDSGLNDHDGRISNGHIEAADSRFRILVIPTNEESVIAREAQAAARPGIAG